MPPVSYRVMRYWFSGSTNEPIKRWGEPRWPWWLGWRRWQPEQHLRCPPVYSCWWQRWSSGSTTHTAGSSDPTHTSHRNTEFKEQTDENLLFQRFNNVWCPPPGCCREATRAGAWRLHRGYQIKMCKIQLTRLILTVLWRSTSCCRTTGTVPWTRLCTL